MKSFLQIAERVREFIPDSEIRIHVVGEPTPLTTDDPQAVHAHREALKWVDAQLETGKHTVSREPATADDYAAAGVWCYPTHLPEPQCAEVARLAQLHGAIPVFNPIGLLAEYCFAGIPLYGIPVLDALVRVRYAYETVRLLSDAALQEQIRVPMMEYARSKSREIALDAAKIEGWMTVPELEWLAEMAGEMATVAEIGCWKGRSTTAMASACQGVVFAIDHWKGGKDEPVHIREAAADDKIYRDFIKNTADMNRVVVIKRPSVEAASAFGRTRGRPDIDMTFIDAGHGLDDVVADIRAWLPKTRRLICGHDFDWADVRRAVEQELGPVNQGPGLIWYKWLDVEAQSNAAD